MLNPQIIFWLRPYLKIYVFPFRFLFHLQNDVYNVMTLKVLIVLCLKTL